jgi:GDP-D-mannose 3', 5'-epimerase
MQSSELHVVAGGGGFIGGHLVKALVAQGKSVRAVDVKPIDEWYQVHPEAHIIQADLSDLAACRDVSSGASTVYNLAADMGGMGFIENNKAKCMLSVLPSTHMLMAAHEAGAHRYFYSSSACVYAAEKQTEASVVALREEDAYPAMPEDGYGWEKLFSERMARHFLEDFGFNTRCARYHNVYGPYGTWRGGREKAPAAIIRKVLEAKHLGTGSIEIWGDGEQTRSFMFVDDCVYGTLRLTESDHAEPLNVGSSELVSINQLVSIVEDIAGVRLERHYDLSAPRGVRGRNSDNTKIREVLNWEPTTTLRAGLEKTYEWIEIEMMNGSNISR